MVIVRVKSAIGRSLSVVNHSLKSVIPRIFQRSTLPQSNIGRVRLARISWRETRLIGQFQPNGWRYQARIRSPRKLCQRAVRISPEYEGQP
jgi:hypothetical protein